MIKLDINKYLTSKTFNIDNVNYYDTKENRYIKVLDMNKAQLKRICNSYGFTSFLSTSNSQLKLSKNLKELNVHTIGMSFLPHSLFNKEFDNRRLCFKQYSNSSKAYLIYIAINKIGLLYNSSLRFNLAL